MINNKSRTIIASILFLFVINIVNVQGYDDEVAHPRMTALAAKFSQIENILKGEIAFKKGTDETLQSGNEIHAVLDWLTLGAKKEDSKDVCQRSNHFHNPINPDWLYAGLSKNTWTCDNWDARYYGVYQAFSALTWATGYITTPPTLNKAVFSIDANYQPENWDKARDYYYKALTLRSATDREINFASAFEALGHVLHLLQDMGVPAHVRDDFYNSHIYPELLSNIFYRAIGLPFRAPELTNPYESYVKLHFNDLLSELTSTSTTNFIIKPSLSNARITDFWDNNLTPDVVTNTTLQDKAGLSEYTNVNFISEATLFSSGSFTYPTQQSTVINRHDVDPNNTGRVAKKAYFYKISDWETNYHLAGFKYISYKLPANPPKPIMDDIVHEDYAIKLLPRVIGYSTALLDYFFRGKLSVTSISDGNGEGLKITNMSGETMHEGMIAVYCDNVNKERELLVEQEIRSPVLTGQSITLYFSPPAVERYIVVFQGRLGNEAGAVIGKVSSPASIYYVAGINGVWKILKMDPDGGNQSVVYDNPYAQIIGRIAVSPDGSTLAFSVSPDGLISNTTIQLLDLADPNALPTVLTAGNWPSWSPDGRKIVFEREQDIGGNAYFDIYTVEVATGAISQLTFDGDSMEPAWSPTEDKIAFTQFQPTEENCSTMYTIYLINASGTPIGPLTCPPAGEYMTVGDEEPAWSPDGQQIAFSRKKYYGRSYQLYKVTVNNNTITKLTDSPDIGYDELGSAWSLDGNSIAIGSARDGDFDIWLVGSGGGYQTNLTNSNSGTDSYPAFGK